MLQSCRYVDRVSSAAGLGVRGVSGRPRLVSTSLIQPSSPAGAGRVRPGGKPIATSARFIAIHTVSP